MQAASELSDGLKHCATLRWLQGRDDAVYNAQKLLDLGVHKQIVNRLLEPWMWITVICTATEYGNFFNLRCDPAAQPEMQKLAYLMRNAYYASEPTLVPLSGWHLPLIFDEDRAELGDAELVKVSVGRCARVSYLTHDGKRDRGADIELHDRLATSGHWSPFEHVARPMGFALGHYSGNFHGWYQYRQDFANQNRTEYTRGDDSAE